VRASGRYKTRYKTPTHHLKFVNEFNAIWRDRRFPLDRTILEDRRSWRCGSDSDNHHRRNARREIRTLEPAEQGPAPKPA